MRRNAIRVICVLIMTLSYLADSCRKVDTAAPTGQLQNVKCCV
jgi:hypothetical protein